MSPEGSTCGEQLQVLLLDSKGNNTDENYQRTANIIDDMTRTFVFDMFQNFRSEIGGGLEQEVR